LIALIKIDGRLRLAHIGAKSEGENPMTGIDDVVAAETVLSDVDGTGGRLIIRGVPVEELAPSATAESAASLLFGGFFPDLPDEKGLARALGDARRKAFLRLEPQLPAIASLPPVEALRAGLSFMPDGDDLETALRLIGAAAVLTAAIVRLKRGGALLPPDPGMGHAADLLRMMSGTPTPRAAERGLDAYLATVCEHGLNASTFAARIAASTKAGLASAVIAGLCALKGPLHGGAPGPVLDMLNEIGEPARAEAWLADALARGDRLMGFGHRIYRVRDPRADALKAAVKALGRAAGAPNRLALAEAVEKAALDLLRREKPGRPLETNVEFYTAVLLDALGFPSDGFTCVFAAGRILGWIAHAREQEMTGRLIRPKSRYVGPLPKRAA
jgi:citrate synthase